MWEENWTLASTQIGSLGHPARVEGTGCAPTGQVDDVKCSAILPTHQCTVQSGGIAKGLDQNSAVEIYTAMDLQRRRPRMHQCRDALRSRVGSDITPRAHTTTQ